MECIVIAMILTITLIVLKTIYKINVNEIKQIGENKDLDEIVNKYPSNLEICKTMLKILNNENVQIQEEPETNNCLYIAVSNKIIIANMRNSFTRIQTIAHECLHSIQDRSILLFNFIYSNIYIIYFMIIAMLSVLNLLPNKMLFLSIYIFMGFIYYFVRSYLENDAMIKAKFLAKEYMEEQKLSSEEEIKTIIDEYDKLNNVGIKATNYGLFTNTVIKAIILSIIMII